MKYGLSDSAISKIQSVFAKFPAIEKTVLYGSRAKGNYKPGSDIDLSLFGDDLTEKILGDVFFELDDLLLPYMIDLSIFEHIDNVNLREHIERVGVIFYEKMSESGWPGWKDKKDEDKSRNILKSSNPVNPDSDSGWEVKKLGEICEVIGGGTPSKKNSKFYGGTIFWATVRDLKDEYISDTEHKITQEAIHKSSTNIFPKGNVVIATRVGLGKICLIKNDTAINQDLRGILPKKNSKL